MTLLIFDLFGFFYLIIVVNINVIIDSNVKVYCPNTNKLIVHTVTNEHSTLIVVTL